VIVVLVVNSNSDDNDSGITMTDTVATILMRLEQRPEISLPAEQIHQLTASLLASAHPATEPLAAPQQQHLSAQPRLERVTDRAPANLEAALSALAAEVQAWQRRPELAGMRSVRAALPAALQREAIVQAVRSHQVVVVCGETGSGKTTQVPQYLLDSVLGDNAKEGALRAPQILCTQPRRISAISVAERVAAERGVALGTAVGYQIRLEDRRPRSHASILFATTGIVLRQLVDDPQLATVTHLILDEVHERSADSDLLLMAVRALLPQRPELRVVVMSATINSELFVDYFGADHAKVVAIPGTLHPVRELFLEDLVHLVHADGHRWSGIPPPDRLAW
jgi:ATP-dependent RNA helicase DHX36